MGGRTHSTHGRRHAIQTGRWGPKNEKNKSTIQDIRDTDKRRRKIMRIGQDMLCLFPQSAGSCTQQCARASPVLPSVLRLYRAPPKTKILSCRVSVKIYQYTPPLHCNTDTPCDFPIVWTAGRAIPAYMTNGTSYNPRNTVHVRKNVKK